VRCLIILLLLCARLSAATLYCSPAGGGSGANFSNLATLPTTTGFTRGNVYVIVEGSYGSKTLSTAASGTTTITIRKASALDSAVTGYASSLHDGQATFGTITVSTQYWIIDGQTRTETNRMEAPDGYGIRADSLTGLDEPSVDAGTASNSQFSYLDIGGAWDEDGTPTSVDTDGSALRFVYCHHHLTFTRCIFHNKGTGNSAMAMMHGTEDITFDHCDFYFGWGKATVATPNVGQQRHVTKFCRFWNAAQSDPSPDAEGPGITTELGTYTHTEATADHLVYGCVFYGTASGGRNAVVWYGNNFDPLTATGCRVFNNTFVGFPESPVFAHIYLAGSDNEARNNLFWDITGSMEVTSNTASNNVDAVSDPFVDYANRDFRLSAATTSGANTGSPYDVDPLGNTRGADGTWDVGAYEYDAGGGGPGETTIGTLNATTITLTPP
jgi:hypothetical protein